MYTHLNFTLWSLKEEKLRDGVVLEKDLGRRVKM